MEISKINTNLNFIVTVCIHLVGGIFEVRNYVSVMYAMCFCSVKIIDVNQHTVSIELITKTMKLKIKLHVGASY